MSYLLSFLNGQIGYGLPKDLDAAIAQGMERAKAMYMEASLVDRETFRAVGWFRSRGGWHYEPIINPAQGKTGKVIS